MNSPIYNIRKLPNEIMMNQTEVYNFNNFSTKFCSPNKFDHNTFILNPIYPILKEDNFTQDSVSQPFSNYMNSSQKLENRCLKRGNTALSLKPQSSLHNRPLNNNIDYYKYSKGTIKKIKKVKSLISNQFCKENNISYSHTNNKILPGYNYYTNVYYSYKSSPNSSPTSFIIKRNIQEDNYFNKNDNNNENLSENKTRTEYCSDKKIVLKSNETKIRYVKKMNNARRQNYNINTEDININNNINNLKKNFETKTLKRKVKREKGYEKNSKLINYIHSCESIEKIKNNDLPFQNNFYHEIGNKPCNNQNDENDKNNDINKFKSYKLINQKKNMNANLSKKIINFNSYEIPYKLSNAHYSYQKGIEILKKIIKKRTFKSLKSLKYLLLRPKSYNNFFVSKTGNTISYDNYSKMFSPIIEIENARNELDIQNKSHSSKKVKKDKNNEKYNSHRIKCKLIFNENKLRNVNSKIMQNNNKLFKKLQKKKGQKPEVIQNKNPLKNLLIENKRLKNDLKSLYAKYFFNKKMYSNNLILNKALYAFNKNANLKDNENKRKYYLLYNIIKIKEKHKYKILQKYFFKFYTNSKLLFYKNIQKNSLLKEKLIKIFYKFEKNIFMIKKKYFGKYYFNSLIRKSAKLELRKNKIERRCNNNNSIFTTRRRKLKNLIKKITDNNSIILKSNFKQWVLRAKLLKKNKVIIKENNKKSNLSSKEELKNKKKNSQSCNSQKLVKNSNLIKGINKLNDIFKSKTENSIKKEDSNYNFIYDENIKNEYSNWTIEEKEEEQSEENGESISFKFLSDHIEDNNNIARHSNDIRSNSETNNE